MLKNSKIHISETIQILADLGFLGINEIHKNSSIPHKSSKNKKITKEQKRQNKALAKQRIAVEHVNRMTKRFLILKNLTGINKNDSDLELILLQRFITKIHNALINNVLYIICFIFTLYLIFK